jgi:GT2 family glycosyltransferase
VDLCLVDQVWPQNPVTRRYLALDQTVGATTPIDVEQPAAACLMVRRDVLDALGGLDETFFPAWFEDVDLCRRIRQAGWPLLHVPDARVTHRGGEAMRALGLARFSRAFYRNMRRYARKHHRRPVWIALDVLIAGGMTVRALWTLLSGRPRDARGYARVALDAVLPVTARRGASLEA